MDVRMFACVGSGGSKAFAILSKATRGTISFAARLSLRARASSTGTFTYSWTCAARARLASWCAWYRMDA